MRLASENGKGYSGNKEKHRKNHVLKMESMPWNMLQLACPPLKNGPTRKSRQANKYSVSPCDPEHIESS
jgi:hypothetical protein